MRSLTLLLLALATALAFNVLLLAQKAPETIVFPTKMGNVTFNHAAHAKKANEDCKACHDKLFPQSKAAINYKGAMHKTAEAAHTACAGCHYAGGPSFESKGNCGKCHVKG
jgi:c(7)-type cytochrome triheme protein